MFKFNFALSGGSGFGTTEFLFGSTSTGTLSSTVSGGQVCSTLQEQLTISTELQGNFFDIGVSGANTNIILTSNSSSTQVCTIFHFACNYRAKSETIVQSCSPATRRRSIRGIKSDAVNMEGSVVDIDKRQSSISCAE